MVVSIVAQAICEELDPDRREERESAAPCYLPICVCLAQVESPVIVVFAVVEAARIRIRVKREQNSESQDKA